MRLRNFTYADEDGEICQTTKKPSNLLAAISALCVSIQVLQI